MFPQLTNSKHLRREESTHFTRLKHAFSIIANNPRKPESYGDKNQLYAGRDVEDVHHCNAHPTAHSYISNLRLKFRRINGAGPSSSLSDVKGTFSFRALDGKKPKLARAISDNAMDRYVFANAQTVSNDSTDHRLIRMLVKAPSFADNAGCSLEPRRPSFGSAYSFNRSLLSVGPVHRAFRRYSMASSDLTVASEDLTAKEFAEHLGINVYPEEEDDVFDGSISIFVQQHRLSTHAPQSTVLSSTKSTKSKISIMEDTFWMPLTNDPDKSDEEAMPRTSSESAEPYVRPDSPQERRNSLITFADAPCKKHWQGPGSGIRPGRHSAPIPIPTPKPILVQQGQLSRQQRCSPHSDTLFSISSESTSSSFTAESTLSSVSTILTTPSRSPPSPKRIDYLETPQIFAIIKNDLALDSAADGTSSIPVTVKKGRFEITLGDCPLPCSSADEEAGENNGTTSLSSSPTLVPAGKPCVVFQRRKYRTECICDDSEHCSPPFDERRRSLSFSVIE